MVLFVHFTILLQNIPTNVSLTALFLLNNTLFKKVLSDALTLYLEKYSWYYMPVIVHKILIHGCDIIQNINIPIGYLSEEALEARHKEIRKYTID